MSRHDISVFPLAIPLIAGPGAISSTVLLMGAQSGSLAGQIGVTVALIAVLALNLAALLGGTAVMKEMGVTGTNVVGRVFGIVLAALSVQFILDGIKESFGMG